MRKVSVITSLFIFLAFSIGVQPYEASSGYGWGYKKNKDQKIPDVGKYKEILDKYGAFYADFSGDKNIYLTFDNGYEQGHTEKVLDILKEENVPATFFVTGQYVKSEPDLVKRMADENHIIGNHSYHHPDFTTISKASIKKELDTLEKAVAEVSSQKQMQYMRPPKGMFSEKTLKWSKELGYTHIFWSIAFIDWETDNQKGWKYSYDQIMEQIHPGAI